MKSLLLLGFAVLLGACASKTTEHDQTSAAVTASASAVPAPSATTAPTAPALPPATLAIHAKLPPGTTATHASDGGEGLEHQLSFTATAATFSPEVRASLTLVLPEGGVNFVSPPGAACKTVSNFTYLPDTNSVEGWFYAMGSSADTTCGAWFDRMAAEGFVVSLTGSWTDTELPNDSTKTTVTISVD